MKKLFFQILSIAFITFLSTSAWAQNQNEPKKIDSKSIQKDQQSSTPIIPTPPPPATKSGDIDMLGVIEVLPRFDACEDQGLNKKDLEYCAKQKMLEYIYTNLVYPEKAKKNKIEGMAVVQFTVDKEGSMINPKLVRDVEGGCGQAALDVVKKMQANRKWIPGTQRGRLVDVQYNLPIKFKL